MGELELGDLTLVHQQHSAFHMIRLAEYLTLYDLLYVTSAGLLSSATHEEMNTVPSVLPPQWRLSELDLSTEAADRSARIAIQRVWARVICRLELRDAETLFSGPPLFKRRKGLLMKVPDLTIKGGGVSDIGEVRLGAGRGRAEAPPGRFP